MTTDVAETQGLSPICERGRDLSRLPIPMLSLAMTVGAGKRLQVLSSILTERVR